MFVLRCMQVFVFAFVGLEFWVGLRKLSSVAEVVVSSGTGARAGEGTGRGVKIASVA